MDVQPPLCLPTFRIESQANSPSTSLLMPTSSILLTTPDDLVDELDSDGGESEEAGSEQGQQHESAIAEEDYQEPLPLQSQSQLQVEIVNQNHTNMDQQNVELLTPESLRGSELLVDDQFQPSTIILLPSTSTPPSKAITIRYFYPIDPVTSLQQQDPVYDDPQFPVVKTIPEWPPPELVEWRKRKGTGRPKGTAGTKRKANTVSSDEDGDYSSSGTRLVKRVRWKGTDEVSFFEPIPSITVNLRNKPFVSLLAQGPLNGALYRPLSVSPLTPPSEEDEETSLGRGRRRRIPMRRLTYPVQKTQSRKPIRSSFPPALDDDFKPFKKGSLKPANYRTCHQCRRSIFGPPKPKMKCSFIKPDGNQCVHQYCETCIINRYDEPFEFSLKTWTCPVCREICNCSLCLRKQGFGYIWDGALTNELKQKRLRHRMRLQDIPKKAKSTNGTIYHSDKPSMCKWLARRGVVTGTSAWMTQRRKEGVRFVVGRSPSPEPHSSIFVGDSSYLAEFEKMYKNNGEGEGEILGNVAVDGVIPPEQIEPLTNKSEGEGETLNTATVNGIVPAEPIESTSKLPALNSFDVFAQCDLLKGHFFVGKLLKRRPHRSDSQIKHGNTASLPHKLSNVSIAKASPDGEKDDPQCPPQPMMILRPPSKTVGFYARNEDLSEDEAENARDGTVKHQTQVAVEPEDYLSEEDAEGASDDDVEEEHWPVEPQVPEPSLSYSTPPSTSTSNFTTLYTPTSSYARPPSPSQAFQLLLGVPLTTQEYSSSLGLNARGLELEKHKMSGYMVEQAGREGHIVGRSADSPDGNASGLSVNNVSKGLEKAPFNPHIIEPIEDPLNPGVGEYTMPLSLPLPIPGFDDPLKGIYDSSGFDTWFTGDNVSEGTARNSNASGTL